MQERRYSAASLRSVEGGRRVHGRAAAYGVLSQDLGGFKERIQRGAFRDVLKRGADCYALMNHDPNKILGRTASGTLQLSDSNDGLDFMLDLPDTALGNEVAELCSRGDLNQCSFAFRVNPDGELWGEEDYEDEDRCGPVRTLRNIAALQDISLVTYPAYAKGTSAVVVRSLVFPEGIPQTVRERIIVEPTAAEVSESEARRLRMRRLRESL